MYSILFIDKYSAKKGSQAAPDSRGCSWDKKVRSHGSLNE